MHITLGRALRDKRRRQRGGAMIELALVMSLLSVVVLGSIDFGRIAYMAMALTHAARQGAMVGSQSVADTNNFAAMKAAAEASASADIGSITDSATRSCECDVGGAVSVMANCPPTGACAGIVRIRVRVVAMKTFNMITRFPLLPQSVTVKRIAIMRAQ
jgi:Flp pilus assembly protein TadG